MYSLINFDICVNSFICIYTRANMFLCAYMYLQRLYMYLRCTYLLNPKNTYVNMRI